MKKYIYIILLTSLSTIAFCTEKKATRDPFWPIGYTPPPPPQKETLEKKKIVIKKPIKPKPPPPVPISDKDWKMARKLLKINGYASGRRQDGKTSKRTSVVIINLKHYTTGDQIKLTNKKIEFVWTVGAIEQNSVELIHTSATRIGSAIKPQKKAEIMQRPSEALN